MAGPVFASHELVDFRKNFEALLQEPRRWTVQENAADTYRHDTGIVFRARVTNGTTYSHNNYMNFDVWFGDLPEFTMYWNNTHAWDRFLKEYEKNRVWPTVEKVSVIAALAADEDLKKK